MYKLVIEPCKITEKSANFDYSMSPTRKIYFKLYVARNILVSRLLFSCSRPLHSYVESESLLPVHSYSSLDPNSKSVKFSSAITVYALWPVLILSSYLRSVLTTSVFLHVLWKPFFYFVSVPCLCPWYPAPDPSITLCRGHIVQLPSCYFLPSVPKLSRQHLWSMSFPQEIGSKISWQDQRI